MSSPEKASWFGLTIAFSAVIVALVGNILMNPGNGEQSNFSVFLTYFIPTIIFVVIMLNRIYLLKFLLKIVKAIFIPIKNTLLSMDKKIVKTIDKINSQEFIFYSKRNDVELLNNVMLYIKNNEETKK